MSWFDDAVKEGVRDGVARWWKRMFTDKPKRTPKTAVLDMAISDVLMEKDEIDTRRTLVYAEKDIECRWKLEQDIKSCISSGDCYCASVAKAIRISDEAAGYELTKQDEQPIGRSEPRLPETQKK